MARKRKAPPPLLALIEEAAAAPPLPPAIITVARALEIGPDFAMSLHQAGRLPGVTNEGEDYFVDKRAINECIVTLPEQVRTAQQSNVSRAFISDIVEAPAVEDYPHWMQSRHVCETCGHDGVHNQQDWRVRCYGADPRKKKRS